MISRYDFVYLFDVKDGNPNGDPDAGNLPRVDPETGEGLVTDVCLKRKIRDFVETAGALGEFQADEDRYRIFVRSGTALNAVIADAHEATGGMPPVKSGKWVTNKTKASDAAAWICEHYFDVRAFGAVLSTGSNAGQIRGPVQLTFSRSLDPVISSEFAITRCATTDDKVSAKAGVTAQSYRDWEDKQPQDKLRTMGRKFTIPYGLYRCHGYVNPLLAEKTGFSSDDLDVLKRSLDEMFEVDRSASRGTMIPQKCIAFRHDTPLGNARADKLFSRVRCELKQECKDADRPPRSFDDYDFDVDVAELKEQGIEVEYWIL